ncbi:MULTISPECIES: Ku protein [Mesorhizobium]|uniref:Non-homologous end joining protein Ku n=1 Tax=Mesorhizobium denitrificans TaxID=2294114 RepID=A0A371XJC9_9HYPH|nr:MULTISPECIES: Ku protein [Mesorhizobium]RFC69320.1 Ku protein [Mesorhizobium denitrificans]
MAPRPVWKGYLKLSLVTCAIELSNSTTYSEKVSFHVLNRKTGNRVKRIYVDSDTDKPVENDEQVKGYEVEGGEYVLMEEKDFDAVRIESSDTVSLESFVEKSSIEQIYLDTAYYVAPGDKVSEEAFAVIRDAMRAKKMAALARIVLHRRERPVVVEPLDDGLLLTTLRYESTVRRPDTVFDEIRKVKVDKDMLDLAEHIIDKKKGKFDPAAFEDKYENALLEIIKAKKAGKKIAAPKKAAKPSNVVNLFDALKKSLAEDTGGDTPKTKSKKSKAA